MRMNSEPTGASMPLFKYEPSQNQKYQEGAWYVALCTGREFVAPEAYGDYSYSMAVQLGSITIPGVMEVCTAIGLAVLETEKEVPSLVYR